MRMVRIVLALLVLLIALVWLVGLAVPRRHMTSRSASLSRSAEEVWSVLSDVPGFARWAPEVSAVTRLPDQNGHPVYALEGKWPMPLEVETVEPPRRMVTRVVDSGLPFGGTWTWEIHREGSGSRVTLTERGEIKMAPMRTLARFVFGYHANLDAYLEALGHCLGQDVKPGPAPAGARHGVGSPLQSSLRGALLGRQGPPRGHRAPLSRRLPPRHPLREDAGGACPRRRAPDQDWRGDRRVGTGLGRREVGRQDP